LLNNNYKGGEEMKKIHRLMLACIVVALGGSVLATPSTQIWIPSTDLQGFGIVHLGWDSYIKTENLSTGYEATVANGGITVGILPFKKLGLEIGVDYRDINANHQYPLYFNAKLGAPEDAFFKNMPALAAGIFDVGIKKDMTDYNVAYGLLAKNIWKLGRFSAGGYSGNEKLLTSGGKKDNSGFLVSWDRTMPEITDKLWLAMDYMSAKNSYGALSFGAAYSVSPDASFIIGYDIYNDDTAFKPTVTVQVDMNIGVFAEKERK
jgi:hypothetical protein